MKVKFNAKGNITVIAMIILLMPFFMPGGLVSLPGMERINIVFHTFKIVSIVIFIVTMNKSINIYGNKKLLLLFLFYGAGVSIANLIHDANILALRSVVFFPIFVLICLHFLSKDSFKFYTAICYLSGIYNVIQALTVIIYYPNGINHYIGSYWKQTLAGAIYFFGSKNQALFYMLVFLITFVIKEKIRTGKYIKRVYVYIAFFAVEAVRIDSANTLFCLLLFGIIYTVCMMRIQEKFSFLFTPGLYIGFNILIFFFICILAKADNNFIISTIVGLMGRDSTFTNRNLIWAQTLKYFLSNPLIGTGEISFKVLNSIQSQAHNMYLDILYKYGLIAFAPYFFVIIYAGRKLQNYKKNFFGALFVGTMFIMLLHNCFDAMDDYIFIFLIVVFCSLNKKIISVFEKAR